MLLRSGIIVASLTMISRIFGMVRELFVAATFGTGHVADSVNVAFKLPNLFRRIFGEGALASVFVPMFSEKLADSEKNADQFASKIFFFLLIILTLITLVIQYFMPSFMSIMAPGFTGNQAKFDHTVLLCRITCPYLIFICLSALIGGMLNSFNRFASFAATPLILNAGVILGTISMGEYIGKSNAFAWSITISGILQLIFMMIALCNGTPARISTPKIEHSDADIKKLLKLMLPATISSGVTQLNLFISQSFASFSPGAVSILSYADRIYQLPMSIIGVTFGTILLPTLSKLYKSGDLKGAAKTQANCIRIGLVLSVPCSAVIIVLAYPVIKLIYQHGAFTSEDTIRTGDTIAAFSLGLPAFVLSRVFLPIFYANNDTKTPMKITIYTIIVNIICNLIFMKETNAHVGIAIGTTIAAWFNVLLFVIYAKSRGFLDISSGLMRDIFKITLNGLLSAATMHLLYEFFISSIGIDGILKQAFCVLGSIFLSFTIYMIVSFYIGVLDRSLLTNLLRRNATK